MTLQWTDEVDEEAVGFFDSLTEAEIRRRQDLCRLQLKLAHDQGKTEALIDLRRMEDALTASMMRRLLNRS